MRNTLTFASLLAGLVFISADLPAQQHHHHPVSQPSVPQNLPGDSLHRITAPLVDQQGKRFTLADEQGPLTLVSMFYGDCKYTCPIVLENAKRSIAALPAEQRGKARALLISLNPGVDTPASLSKLAALHEMAAPQFRLAVSDNDAHTRQLAAAFGIKYRRAANGEINHSTRFILLDARGTVLQASDKLSVEPDPLMLDAMRRVALK